MGGELKQNNKSGQVISALFDVRPVTKTGDLDIEKVNKIEQVLNLKNIKIRSYNRPVEKELKVETLDYVDFVSDKVSQNIEMILDAEQILAELDEIEEVDNFLMNDDLYIQKEEQPVEKSEDVKNDNDIPLPEPDLSKKDFEDDFIEEELVQENKKEQDDSDDIDEIAPTLEESSTLKESFNILEQNSDLIEQFYFPEVANVNKFNKDTFSVPTLRQKNNVSLSKTPKVRSKSLFWFLIAGILIALIIPAAAWLGQGFDIKQGVMNSSLSAYENLLSAQQSLEQADWQTAEQNFGSAYSDFIEAHQEINKLGRITLGILERLPGVSSVSSGRHLVKVGENLAQAGQSLTSAIGLFSFGNLFDSINLPNAQANILSSSQTQQPLTESIFLSQNNLNKALEGIEQANQELKQIKTESLPDDIQEGVLSLKEKLPLVEQMLNQAKEYSDALLEILGHYNPRQYLLIFQNNSEIRATGGFIGTYGLLTLDRGEIDDLFIDGVFNADGQLHEKIIPPRPIQKISTAWSMHDSNWFADFPSSAKTISWFYEKTGGPTVDGVISLTPTLIERLLELTGPISMPEYEVVLGKENFVELIQYKVEVDYDKQLNQPKKILADFAPMFIEKLSQLSAQEKQKAVEIILDCFKEKHILVYFNNPSLEKIASNEGWSGELLSTDKDYLSVVSSNISGYKTDKVVKETINHQSEIQEDGSIIDTLTIARQHQGGEEEYDWWNRVNSNYLRVYLPLGSELISAHGQSLEIYQSPIDYEEQGFKKDLLVDSIESKMIIDQKTGTRISEENNKTVFGNWVYVSPGETVVVTYKYKLPFKINLTKLTDSYSLLVQKQSGSLGSAFSHKLTFPSDWQVSWQYPEQSQLAQGAWEMISDLTEDRFLGLTFEY
ncbi:MAG: DUF4012 domain-containing protein [bacterium]